MSLFCAIFGIYSFIVTSLIYDLTGVTVENSLKMPGGMDAVLFLAEPDHLFDPKLWSAVKVSGKNDGASEFTIDADGNCLQTEVHAAANKLDEQNTITAPKLLLTDEQIEQLKDLAEPFIDSIKK